MSESPVLSDMPEISLATTGEQREAIYRFRYQIYVEEMRKQPVAADHEKRILRDALDDTAVHFCAVRDGEVVACLRLNRGDQTEFPPSMREVLALDKFAEFGKGAVAVASRLMVAMEYRGSHIVALLLRQVAEHLKDVDIRAVVCHCAPALVQLYEQLGFRRYTDNYAEPDVGYQIPLVLLVRDREHLQAVRSPLLRVTRHLDHDPHVAAWFDRAFPGWTVHVHERLMSEKDLWQYLSRRLHATGIPLFDGLTESRQSQFLTICSVLRCNAGDRVVRAGDVGQEMFVLLSGAAEVRGKAPDGDEIVLATLGKGAVFGEIGYITRTPRTADVLALSDLEVLVLNQQYLRRAMDHAPELAARVLFNLSLILCQRLRSATQSWLDAVSFAGTYEGTVDEDAYFELEE